MIELNGEKVNCIIKRKGNNRKERNRKIKQRKNKNYIYVRMKYNLK